MATIPTPLLAGLLLLSYLALSVLSMAVGIRLLPPQRQRLMRWSILEVLLSVLLYAVCGTFGFLLLNETGLGERLYGAETMNRAVAGQDNPATEAEKTTARQRVGLMSGLIGFPLFLASVLVLFRRLSDIRPYQLGLTTSRWGNNVLLGVFGCLVLTPLVLQLNESVQGLLTELEAEGVKEHPFTSLRRSGDLSGAELALLVFHAVVVAPVTEELLFRGVLLRWLCARKRGSDFVMAASFLAAVPLDAKSWESVRESPLSFFGPPVFVLVMAGLYLKARRRESAVPAAIWSSSLLFGMMHNGAWPSPIPLFVLALGLGWLSYRTQSLIGPIVFHALFNSVACVQLLMMPTSPSP